MLARRVGEDHSTSPSPAVWTVPVQSSARPTPSFATSQPPTAVPAKVAASENGPVATAMAARSKPSAR